MDDSSRQPSKLQKRKSRERQELAMSGGLTGQPAANSSQPLSSSEHTMSSAEKEKRSKWRMSNPFHSKEKDKDNKDIPKDNSRDKSRNDVSDSNADSAYFGSEPRSSANPSFQSNARPVSDEHLYPPPTTTQTFTTHNNATTGPGHDTLAPPQHTLHNRSSREDVGRETYRDAGTGNIVTVTTTTTTTTITTTGPGGSTTVEQPRNSTGSSSSVYTSGPSPPSPAPPMPADHHHQGPGLMTQSSIPESLTPPMPLNHQQAPRLSPQVTGIDDNYSSPPIPPKNNIRHRIELDSVSPSIQRANPMEDPISPVTPGSPTRANFSYPARQTPPGVPRQVPTQQQLPPQQHPQSGMPPMSSQQHRQSDVPPMPAYQQQQAGLPPMPTQQQQQSSLPPSLQSGVNYNDPNRPTPYRAGHDMQKQSTLANLRAAASGIHGAGETLRGTINDTFDRRNPAAHAKNQAVIEKGRSEIEASRPRQQQQRHYRQQQQPQQPTIGCAPPESMAEPSSGPGKSPYVGPSVSGSQIEGRSGKLGNIMKKMKESPLVTNRDGTVGNQYQS